MERNFSSPVAGTASANISGHRIDPKIEVISIVELEDSQPFAIGVFTLDFR